jgi:hypothetical protein
MGSQCHRSPRRASGFGIVGLGIVRVLARPAFQNTIVLIVVGGTSASSPLVAGIFARYGIAATTDHDASFAYTHRTEFFDITSGTGHATSIVRLHDTQILGRSPR